LKEKACILIADDSMDNCTMMTALLGHVGYAVETARTAAAALRLAQDKECDLYVMDSYFTDARGTDLCRQIRALDPLAPVIFYSTAYGEAEAEAALQAGADAYIVKPDIDGLLRTIARLLDKAGEGADPALFRLS